MPSFLWAQPSAPRLAPDLARTPADAARAHLRTYSAAYGLTSAQVEGARATTIHDTGSGPIIVGLRQFPDGVEIFREGVHVAMDRKLDLIAISGALLPAATLGEFRLDERSAVAAALSDLSGRVCLPTDLVEGSRVGPYLDFELAPSSTFATAEAFDHTARAKRVWFRQVSGLSPAYYLEIGLARGGEEPLDYGYVVSAVDGRVLYRHDQIQLDAYSYRVWAKTTAR